MAFTCTTGPVGQYSYRYYRCIHSPGWVGWGPKPREMRYAGKERALSLAHTECMLQHIVAPCIGIT